MAGLVLVNGLVEDKPGHGIPTDVAIEIRGKEHPYVSRGGMKLAGALDAFGLGLNGITALDIGASTGGFTDCLLQRGAVRVFAVDVGRGQLDARIAADPRVTGLEGVNARRLKADDLPGLVDLVTIDVSFISLTRILPIVPPLLSPRALGVLSLVKPQFEAGRDQVGKKGVVRDPSVWADCIERVAACGTALGLIPLDVAPSSILGPKGNVEFFVYLKPGSKEEKDADRLPLVHGKIVAAIRLGEQTVKKLTG